MTYILRHFQKTSAKEKKMKNALTKVIAGGLGFAVVHAAIFWLAYFQCGGSHNSAKSFWQGMKSVNSAWADILKWLGFPLNGIDASGFAFVLLMIINSILWGAVIGVIFGLIFGRKK